MRYFYKDGKLYRIKETNNTKTPKKTKKRSDFFSYILIFAIVSSILYKAHHHEQHFQQQLEKKTHYLLEPAKETKEQPTENTEDLPEVPEVRDIYEELKEPYTPEDKVIKTFDNYFVRLLLKANSKKFDTVAGFIIESEPPDYFVLKAGNKEHYGLRHILARHTRKYFPDYYKARTLFDDDLTANDIVEKLDYFFDHCVKVYLQKKDPYNDSRGVCLGYIKHNGRLIRCLLVYRTSDNSIITFYPLTKQNELNMLDSWRRRYLD